MSAALPTARQHPSPRANDLTSEVGEGEAVATGGLAVFAYKNFYKKDWHVVRTGEELQEIQRQAERTWFVYTFEPEMRSVHAGIMQTLELNFEPVCEFVGTLKSGDIHVCWSK